MPARHIAALCAILTALGGCTGTTVQTPLVPVASLLHGTTGGTEGGNGARFAETGDGETDIEGRTMTVRVARVKRDFGDGRVELEVSDETVTLDATFFSGTNRPSTFTSGGTTYVLADGGETLGDLFVAHRSLITSADYPRETEWFIAEDATDTPVELGFYIAGTETDPIVIDARTATATYSGDFSLRAFAQRETATPSTFISVVRGDLTLEADFTNGGISGDITNGNYTLRPDTEIPGTFEGTIAETDIIGNGFAAGIELSGCTAVECGGSDSVIGGVFYGSDGEHIAGVIALDETFVDGGDELHVLGAGTFATNRD